MEDAAWWDAYCADPYDAWLRWRYGHDEACDVRVLPGDYYTLAGVLTDRWADEAAPTLPRDEARSLYRTLRRDPVWQVNDSLVRAREYVPRAGDRVDEVTAERWLERVRRHVLVPLPHPLPAWESVRAPAPLTAAAMGSGDEQGASARIHVHTPHALVTRVLVRQALHVFLAVHVPEAVVCGHALRLERVGVRGEDAVSAAAALTTHSTLLALLAHGRARASDE